MAETGINFRPPSPLSEHHDLSEFRSGELSLDNWLRQRAFKNMAIAATKTYVVCPENTSRVVGYYALCMGQIFGKEVTGAMRRNMPSHIPVVVLGRLAVDVDWQGNGIGQGLLHDAVSRSLKASEEISARLVVVHAISKQAEVFYQNNGFTRLPVDAPTYALDLVKYERI